MSREREEAVYYREIQKNGYLKRLPPDGSSKLRPLGNKRTAPDAMWTVLCVHNGRTPYLEQYAAQAAAAEHRPAWRAGLQRARHVTASVRPWPGGEFDFLVAAEPPVRMLAPTWDVMQDWVTTLRGKLHELKLLDRGENVYCAPPAPPPPRAGTRDPTSPLPPTPAGPAVRVPGIEPIVASSSAARSSAPSSSEPTLEPAASSLERPEASVLPDSTEPTPEPALPDTPPEEPPRRSVSDWDAAIQRARQPTPGREPERATKKIARICGQSVCVDSRRDGDSDEEFFAEIDRINSGEFVAEAEGVEEILRFDEKIDSYTKVDLSKKARGEGFTQRVVISAMAESAPGASQSAPRAGSGDAGTNNTGTNITVIQVSNNRGPPHTAIPVVGSEADVFDFEFKQKLSISGATNTQKHQEFVNIVNTEENVHVQNENGYGTIFNDETPYGHISLTTTVKLTGEKESDEGIYERLCMASTSNDSAQVISTPSPRRKKKDSIERLKLSGRKTSLPNLEIIPQGHTSGSDPTYEYLFPANNPRTNLNESQCVNVSVNSSTNLNCHESQTNANTNVTNSNISTEVSNSSATNNTLNAHSNTVTSHANASTRTVISTNGQNIPTHRNVTNLHSNVTKTNSNVTNTHSNVSNAHSNLTNTHSNVTSTHSNVTNTHSNVSNVHSNVTNTHSNVSNAHSNVSGSLSNATVTQSNVSTAHSIIVNSSANSTNRSVERSQSQNSYDASAGLLRERARNQTGQNHSPRRESGSSKSDKPQQEPKPAGKGLFRRGLTELSFLSRLKGLGQNGGRQPREPARPDEPPRSAVSPSKVVRRARIDARPADSARRRSSSLSGAAERGAETQSLRARQAAALRAEQARGAAAAARLARADAKREPPVLCDAHGLVWVAWWGRGGAWFGGRAGDRVAAVRGARPRDAAHARQLLRQALASPAAHTVDLLFHRVPHAKIYVLTKEKEEDPIGIKLDGECGIVSVEAGSAAARAGLPPPGPRWAVTEVNSRPLDLLKGGDEEVARLSGRGREVSVLVQPLPLVQKLRSALKTQRILHAVGGLGLTG